jgi:hypothetical protein
MPFVLDIGFSSRTFGFHYTKILTVISITELISEAESDGVAYCSKSGCSETFPDGLITGAAVKKATDGSWIQVSSYD